MTPSARLARLGLSALVCTVVIWGVRYLPPNDYQPSRPLYAFGWLVAAAAGYLLTRKYDNLVSHTFLMLIYIFVIFLFIAFLIR